MFAVASGSEAYCAITIARPNRRRSFRTLRAPAALRRRFLHATELNLHSYVVGVPLSGELLHRDRLPAEAELPVAALPHALGQHLSCPSPKPHPSQWTTADALATD
jgi:hypothetical protein